VDGPAGRWPIVAAVSAEPLARLEFVERAVGAGPVEVGEGGHCGLRYGRPGGRAEPTPLVHRNLGLQVFGTFGVDDHTRR